MWTSLSLELWRSTGILQAGEMIGNDLKTERKWRKSFVDFKEAFLCEGCWRATLGCEGVFSGSNAAGPWLVGDRGGGGHGGTRRAAISIHPRLCDEGLWWMMVGGGDGGGWRCMYMKERS